MSKPITFRILRPTTPVAMIPITNMSSGVFQHVKHSAMPCCISQIVSGGWGPCGVTVCGIWNRSAGQASIKALSNPFYLTAPRCSKSESAQYVRIHRHICSDGLSVYFQPHLCLSRSQFNGLITRGSSIIHQLRPHRTRRPLSIPTLDDNVTNRENIACNPKFG
jgi:hypothetical protein